MSNPVAYEYSSIIGLKRFVFFSEKNKTILGITTVLVEKRHINLNDKT